LLKRGKRLNRARAIILEKKKRETTGQQRKSLETSPTLSIQAPRLIIEGVRDGGEGRKGWQVRATFTSPRKRNRRILGVEKRPKNRVTMMKVKQSCRGVVVVGGETPHKKLSGLGGGLWGGFSARTTPNLAGGLVSSEGSVILHATSCLATDAVLE